MKKQELMSNLYVNVKHFAKERGIPLRDLETVLGMTPGYFSRGKGCSIDKVSEAARILGTTIETLLDEPHTTNVMKLHDFFVKLTTETYNGKQTWYTSHDGYHCNFASGASVIVWEEKEYCYYVDIVVSGERSALYRSDGGEAIPYLDNAVSSMLEVAEDYTKGPQISAYVQKMIDNFIGGSTCTTSGLGTK